MLKVITQNGSYQEKSRLPMTDGILSCVDRKDAAVKALCRNGFTVLCAREIPTVKPHPLYDLQAHTFL